MLTVAGMPTTLAIEPLRQEHAVRLVTKAEEGSGVNTLPAGVYGYTYSPALPNAPLFSDARYRSYETHKVASGEVFVIGYAAAQDAERIESAVEDATVRIQPQPEGACDTLVKIPYSRIRRHRQYAAPNQDGFTVTLAPR